MKNGRVVACPDKGFSGKILILFITIFLLASGVWADAPSVSNKAIERDRLFEIAKSNGFVKVLVELAVPDIQNLTAASVAHKGITPGETASYAAVKADAALAGQMSAATNAVTSRLSQLNRASYKINHTYSLFPFLALDVSEKALTQLELDPGVLKIFEDRPVPLSGYSPEGTSLKHLPSPANAVRPLLNNTASIIGADNAWAQGYTGSGWYAAILDTGIRSSHEFFNGKTIIEACFSAVGHCPNEQTEMYGSSAAAHHPSYYDGYDHGTHVAGIAAGNNGSLFGVAKDADIIAIQVFSRFSGASNCGDRDPCVLSYTSDQIKGLEYIYSIRGIYSIASANMSLGGGKYNNQTTCDSDKSNIKTAIDNLRAAGIATIIATGNNGYCGFIGAPGCISSAIAIGASTDSDQQSSFSNWNSDLQNLFAPGSSIYSSTGSSDSSYASWNGTSMATPHVTGAWALLKDKSPAATVDDILNALSATGAPVSTSCSSGGSKPRIQVDDAINVLGSSDASAPTNTFISINNGATPTTLRNVTLSLAATDNVGVTGYYVSESSTTPSLSAFISLTSTTSYSADVSFTLSSGDGTKTVYAWFRDVTGNISFIVSDTIVLSAAGGGDQYSSTDIPKTINDNTTITSTISITDNTCCITDIDVGITLTHSFDSDLDIYLISPDGTRVELSTDNGSSGDNYTSTIFDDDAATSITTGSAPFSGSFRPEGSLATLDNKSINGTWTLEITDDASGDTGELTGWYLSITTSSSDTTAPQNTSININSGASSATSRNVTLSLAATDNVGVTGYYVSESSITPSLPAFISLTSTTGYSADVSFTLSSGDGTKTVYAWFRDAAGNISSIVSDPIVLSTAGGGNQYNSTDVPKTINNNATITSTISITENTCCITDINVGITLTHSWDADLDIYLISPDGTRVELSTDNGGSGNNYTSTIFDDEAATSITAGSAPFNGSFRPEGSLATLDNKSINGTWTLEITDDYIGDTGELTGWYLRITTTSSSDTTAPQDTSININSGASSTTSRNVTLSLAATDNVGVTGYYVSESSSTPSLSTFISLTSTTGYSADVSFTLSSGNGTKTVYAWFRDAAGNISSQVSDTIDYTFPAISLPFNEDFESGNLANYWSTNNSGTGRLQVASPNSPYAGDYHLTMDSSTDGTYSLNELVLTIDLVGESNVQLSFYHKEFTDEDNTMSSSFTNSENSDGVAVSVDGTNWYKVQGLTSTEIISTTYKKFTVSLDPVFSANGLSYTNSVMIKFQQYDNYGISIDGFAFDNIQIIGSTGADNTAPANTSISINNGASFATAADVTLSLAATDNVGVTGYYVSESSTTPSLSAFISLTSTTGYSADVSFTLSSGNGTKTVYAWFRDTAGNISSRVPDSIALNIAENSNQYNSTDIPKTINDNTTITSTISITDNTCCITDIDVGITLAHSWDSDLDIYLISPDGVRVELSTDNGGSGNNYTSTIFDDDAATSITTGSAPFSGSFRPEGSLATLDNKSINGTWTLEITDDYYGDTGELTGWYLSITTTIEIPTLSEWGMLLFVILLLSSGMYIIIYREGAKRQ